MLIYLPSVIASSFLGYKLFYWWQHRSLQSDLQNSVLDLWKIESQFELVDFTKATLQKLFSTKKESYCFCIQSNKSIVEFYSREKILCEFSRPKNGKMFYKLRSSCAERDWLAQNGFLGPSEEVFLIFIHDEFHEEAERLIFLVHEKSLRCSESLLTTYINHACACYSRLFASAGNEVQHSLRSSIDDALDVDLLDALSMQKTLNQYILQNTASDGCCLLFNVPSINQIVCYVVNDTILDYEVLYSIDSGFFADIFSNKNPTFYQHCSESLSKNNQDQVQLLFNFRFESLCCIPIIGPGSDQTASVVCLVDKSDKKYSSSDVSLVNTTMKRSWKRLSYLLALHEEREMRKQCETMLKIAKNLFIRLGDVGQLLGEVIQEARSLTNAERCSVFLVDKVSNELVAKIFDGIATMDENMKEVRISLDQGIAGHVAITGKAVNIVDAYSHPLFYQGIDHTTGFKTRNILCFPIKGQDGDVVGVAELCNKIKGHCFTSNDEKLAERFAVFCGISLVHSLMYKAIEESGSRNRLANDLVALHMKVEESDIEENIPRQSLSMQHFARHFDDFIYKPRDLEDDRKIKACIFMYQDLGLVSAFHIPINVLVHFLLMVRKGYRTPPYHNFDHAFSVMHHAYLLAKNLQLNRKLGNQEVMVLLTACICHDLDHRGTNNAFQINSQSLLANLYSSEGSVLERHHFAQAVCILSTAGCNIFENMKRKAYNESMALMKHLILATDIATHFTIMPELEALTQKGINFEDDHHKKLLLSLCMTASDLSDQTKDWTTTIETSKLIYCEFFYQGDMEKRMGSSPALINDRDKACVPELQIKFMEHVALPAYKILANLFTEYEIVFRRFLLNLDRWRRVENEFQSQHLHNRVSLSFLVDVDQVWSDLFRGLEEI